MVEVFKTNVKDYNQAKNLIDKIHIAFAHYKANFDLEDCDNILRIECNSGILDVLMLIHFLEDAGCIAEVLPEDSPAESIFTTVQE